MIDFFALLRSLTGAAQRADVGPPDSVEDGPSDPSQWKVYRDDDGVEWHEYVAPYDFDTSRTQWAKRFRELGIGGDQISRGGIIHDPRRNRFGIPVRPGS